MLKFIHKWLPFPMLLLAFSCGEVKRSENPALDVFAQPQAQAAGLMLVATVSEDYRSGGMALVPIASPKEFAQGINLTTSSDFFLRCRGQRLYRIDGFNRDLVTIYDRSKPDRVLSQVLTKPVAEPTSSVPTELAFGPNDRALLLRHSRNRALWMAVDNNNFRQRGELNLTNFADNDGYAEPKSALFWDGNWYVTLQRLNRNAPDAWSAGNVSQLVIANEMTAESKAMQAFDLRVRNPMAKMLQQGNFLYIAGAGDLARLKGEFGGIEVIERTTNSTNPLDVVLASRRVLLAGKQIIDVQFFDQSHLLALEYLGANKTALRLVNINNDQLFTLPADLKRLNDLTDGYVSALDRDPQGQLWLSVFGGNENGLVRFQAGGIKAVQLPLKLRPVSMSFCP